MENIGRYLNMKSDSKFCVYQETAKANLRQHEISKHTDNEGKQKCLKKCSYCNCTSLRIRNLKQHITSVHEGVSHQCDRDSCDASRKILWSTHQIYSWREQVQMWILQDWNYDNNTTNTLKYTIDLNTEKSHTFVTSVMQDSHWSPS